VPEPPPPPDIQYGIFTVVDNGEGANDPPDEGSALRGVNRANAFLHCTVGLPRPTAPSIRETSRSGRKLGFGGRGGARVCCSRGNWLPSEGPSPPQPQHSVVQPETNKRRPAPAP